MFPLFSDHYQGSRVTTFLFHFFYRFENKRSPGTIDLRVTAFDSQALESSPTASGLPGEVAIWKTLRQIPGNSPGKTL